MNISIEHFHLFSKMYLSKLHFLSKYLVWYRVVIVGGDRLFNRIEVALQFLKKINRMGMLGESICINLIV